MAFWSWSKTAASNATADSTINWAEGQAPSSVNDSARAMMARIAEYRDDTGGAILATGSGSAYVITSNQVFPSFTAARLSEFCFVCPATNVAGVTLNLDGTGAQPINGTDGVAVPAGSLISGGVYRVTAYTGEWILHGFYGSSYNIPLGGMMDYIGSTVPNSNFVFPIGQAISRTTYATLFSLVSTAYGAGDGSTTFNVPDLTGRVTAMKEAVATRLTSTYFAGNSTSLGAVGGGESTTLTAAQIPTITSTVSVTTATNNVGTIPISSGSVSSLQTQGAATTNITPANSSGSWSGSTSLAGTGSGTATSNNTSGTAHRTVPPTIIVNKILRII